MAKIIGILIESDFYEKEIIYYQVKFPQAGFEVRFLSRLWGYQSLTFDGHETKMSFECSLSLENISDSELNSYSAIIIPSGYVSDRLRYTEDITKISPAATFIERAFANKNILKGVICHGLWLLSPIAGAINRRKVTCHNNLVWDARAYGAEYCNEDIVVDGDLVTARSGDHCELFAEKIIEILNSK